MKRILLLPLVLFAFLSNCTINSNGKIEVRTIEVDKFDYQTISTDSLIKWSDKIILQDLANTAIGSGPFIIESNTTGVYIFDKWFNKKILHFDLNGNFINSIGKIGKGPEEYLKPYDAVINKNHAYILASNKKIYKYNINGDLSEILSINSPKCYSLSLDNDSNFWLYAGNNEEIEGKLLLYDSKSKKTIKYFFNPNKDQMPNESNTFSNNLNGEILFWEPIGNLISKIEKQRVTPFIKINWGNKDIDLNFLNKKDFENFISKNETFFINNVIRHKEDTLIVAVRMYPNNPPEGRYILLTKNGIYTFKFNPDKNLEISPAQLFDIEGNILFLVQPQNYSVIQSNNIGNLNQNPFVLKLNIRLLEEKIRANGAS